jgi:hypothetical protein
MTLNDLLNDIEGALDLLQPLEDSPLYYTLVVLISPIALLILLCGDLMTRIAWRLDIQRQEQVRWEENNKRALELEELMGPPGSF